MHRHGAKRYCAVLILVISTLLIQNTCPNNLIGKFFPTRASKENCCMKQGNQYTPINSGADSTNAPDKDNKGPGAIFLTLTSSLSVETFPEVLSCDLTKQIPPKQATAKLPDKPPDLPLTVYEDLLPV